MMLKFIVLIHKVTAQHYYKVYLPLCKLPLVSALFSLIVSTVLISYVWHKEIKQAKSLPLFYTV